MECTDYSYGRTNVLYNNLYSRQGRAQIISVIDVLRSCTNLNISKTNYVQLPHCLHRKSVGLLIHRYGHAARGGTWQYSRSFSSDQTAGKVFSIQCMPYIVNSKLFSNYFSWWSCNLLTIWPSSFEVVSHIKYLPLLLLQCIIIIIQYLTVVNYTQSSNTLYKNLTYCYCIC